jgi:acyl-coenzyme A synthetase/AMP-(fatty) acid ligase
MAGLLTERFHRVVRDHAGRIAIHGLSERLTRTFAELGDDIGTLRRALDRLKLPPRPTVLSNIGNRSGFIALFVASLDASATLLLVDGDAPAPEVIDLADAYDADLIVVPAGTSRFTADRVPLPCGLAGIVRTAQHTSTWRLPHEDEALVLKVTSGSSGRAKAVVASVENLISDGDHVAEAMDITSRDVSLAAIPLSHSYGVGNLLLPLLLKGSPVVLRDRFLPMEWARDVSQYGITMFPGVPLIFDHLRQLDPAAAPLAGIRLLVTAGAPIDFRTVADIKHRFGVKVHSLYGSSETGSITFDSSSTISDPVSVGWPLPGTNVRLIDDSATGDEGRVHIRSAAVCRRYAFADTDGERSSAFVDEGFLTADIGTRDNTGSLTLVGRVSPVVNIAGRKVHPREVERAIADLPGIVHVWVTGVRAGGRGQELVACVQRAEPTLSERAIRTHCEVRLSSYKVPKRIIFADQLPVSGRGKTTRVAVEAYLRATLGMPNGI